jgi:hypothetical protein
MYLLASSMLLIPHPSALNTRMYHVGSGGLVEAWLHLLRQYLYFCTSKARKLSTMKAEALRPWQHTPTSSSCTQLWRPHAVCLHHVSSFSLPLHCQSREM